MEQYDVIVVGGGFFGCSLAAHVKTPHNRVLLLEKEADLMTRASYNNQARVHGGYHYTRSLLTALRSRINFVSFVAEYEDCIDSSFVKYYAVAKQFSKISAAHFYEFCKRIGADVAVAPKHISRLFNDDLVQGVFTVREYAFDSLKLRQKIKQRLAARNVEYRLRTEVEKLCANPDGSITLTTTNPDTGVTVNLRTARVFNCAYSHINQLNHASNLPLIPFKHELTEMALIEVPEELREVGITIMDGPFFSVMPFPPRGLHTFSHVRYTPHVEWHDVPAGSEWRNGHDFLARHKPRTAFHKMLADAQRYLPALAASRHVDSLWEVKTVLPASETSDSRPILFVPGHGGIDGYTCIMGGKIDNIQDILREVDIQYGG
jgi:glycine/D-amino acid oxidase-like deaminating enzyme